MTSGEFLGSQSQVLISQSSKMRSAKWSFHSLIKRLCMCWHQVNRVMYEHSTGKGSAHHRIWETRNGGDLWGHSSPRCPTPCYAAPCQNGAEPENRAVACRPEPKETSVSLAGFQVSMRLWGRRAFAGNRFQPHSELFFSFPILLQMSKLFTLHWHPKMILLLPWLQLKQYFFMLHRLPTSWLKTRNVTGHSISTCHEKKNKGKRQNQLAGKIFLSLEPLALTHSTGVHYSFTHSIKCYTIWTWIWANSGRQWRTEEPSTLQSMGSWRVGHDLVTEQQQLSSVRFYEVYQLTRITPHFQKLQVHLRPLQTQLQQDTESNAIQLSMEWTLLFEAVSRRSSHECLLWKTRI